MPTNLALIQPRPLTFRTSQNTDWLDGLPIFGLPATGGVVAGSSNIGNGSLTVTSVSTGTKLGAHVLAVTSLAGGLTRFTITDPSGAVTAQGVAGVATYAGGISFTLTQGGTPLSVGDSFAISILIAPIDIAGLTFALDARASQTSAQIALSATSAPTSGATTILAGTTGGNIAMNVPRATMALCPAGTYPFDLLATDPSSGLTVTAFYGVIKHVTVASLWS